MAWCWKTTPSWCVKELFIAKCGSCHVLADAGTKGQIGPNLDDAFRESRLSGLGESTIVQVLRGQIADPDFVTKARDGRTEEIRYCIACNQNCYGRVGLNKTIGCEQNPAIGAEAREGEHHLRPALRRKRVMVAGGGPAGMWAAKIATMRGHEVTLYEKGDFPEHSGTAVNGIATIYNRMGDYAQAQQYFEQAAKAQQNSRTFTMTWDGTANHGSITYPDIVDDNIMVITAVARWMPHLVAKEEYVGTHFAYYIDQTDGAFVE